MLVMEMEMSALEKLCVDRTTAAIMAAARDNRYLCYADVAAASDLEWSFELSRNINKHLNEVLIRADAEGLPLITSIVVNKPNLVTGRLGTVALRGFAKCANGLGYQVGNLGAESFLSEQQRETFAFAASQKRGLA